MSVWITRSAPDNLRTARELHALGHRPLVVPVVRSQPLELGKVPLVTTVETTERVTSSSSM